MKKLSFAILLLIGAQSCKIESADSYEMKVLIEIFDDVIEEIGILNELEIPPPAPNYGIDVEGYDTVNYNRKIDEIEKRNSKMRDTTFVIAVFDTLFAGYDENLNIEYIKTQLTDQDYIEVLNIMNNHSVSSLPLRLHQIGKKEGITLKYYSEFSKIPKVWERENYDFLLLGVLRMSRIYFDKNKRVGLFYYSYACGPLCGEEAIMCIRKINDKWTIEKKILLGVS